VCHYRGTLVDGTEFDSSYKRSQPATFPVKKVIKGWAEALQLMPVGSKWQLFIPPQLAYGERGAPGVIGPNATLIFEVELVPIQDTDIAHASEKKDSMNLVQCAINTPPVRFVGANLVFARPGRAITRIAPTGKPGA